MWVAAILGLASVVAFLFLIDYAARLLRPVSILWRVGEEGLAVIESVYPKSIRDTDPLPVRHAQLGAPDRIVSHQGTSAIVLAVNLEALVAEANRVDGVIEVVPRVGDFVAVGEPVFLLHGGSGAFDERKLRGSIAFGPERTIEQDSTFAFRVIVDIAIRALSKAINDPTTAVLAIDQLHRLLRTVGRRHLHDEQIMDDAGRLRVIFPTPNWGDFVQLAFREIRLYGAENFQIARRLRAMIDNLMKTLPESRRPALRLELDLLDRTRSSTFSRRYRVCPDFRYAGPRRIFGYRPRQIDRGSAIILSSPLRSLDDALPGLEELERAFSPVFHQHVDVLDPSIKLRFPAPRYYDGTSAAMVPVLLMGRHCGANRCVYWRRACA